MSCQIKTISALADQVAIKNFLYPNSSAKNASDSRSNPNDFAYMHLEEYNSHTEQILDQSWLQDCLISFSPTSDFLVLATTERILFLSLKWDNHEEKEIKAKFVVQWESVLFNENCEEISSVLCIPLVSQKRSSQGSPDWTCVIIGFTSGYVKMYTETGLQLFSQIFHDGPVLKLNCRTYEPPRHNKTSEQHEELVILYPWAVVTIDGFSLYQTLRACRNQVAKATASGVDVANPPPLAYKKWGVQDQSKVTDCHNVGVIPSNTFDHLQTASLLGGFTAVPRNTIPVASLVLATGQNPYLAFYFAMEGSSPPLMSEVATAVVSKMKSYFISAASGIFGISNKHPDPTHLPKPKIEPATPLACRFALPDSRRNGDSIIISPNKALGVVTDSFGRVILLDTHLGIAIRMWKGYRDAQCGWVEVVEDTHRQDKEKVTPVPRVALFLVIYAPRRGLLEVWTAQQGPRVAAFNVSKWARLVCPGYSMMGLNSFTPNYKKIPSAQCFLIDPDGPIKTISIPFHYALSDKNSKRAKSLHLLRKMKIALKESINQDEKFIVNITKMVCEISTPSIKQQALETLSRNKKASLSLMESVVSTVFEQLQMQEFEMMDFENKLLFQNTHRLKQLLQLYQVALTANEKQHVFSGSPLTNEIPVNMLSEILVFSEVETEQAMLLLQQHLSSIKTKSVCFSDEKNLTPSSFLSCFHVFVHHLNKDQSSNNSRLSVDLHPNISKEEMENLGCYLFKSSLQGTGSLEELQKALIDSGLLAEKILVILIEFCLSHIPWLISWECIVNYSSAIKFITYFADSESVNVSCNEVSSWWQNIRSILTQSSNSPLAYISAVVSRGAALSIASFNRETENELKNNLDKKNNVGSKNNEAKATNCGDFTLNEWESVSMEALQWNLLVKQLEDLMILSSLLNFQIPDFSHSESNHRNLSINSLSDKGRGIVSELVSEWLIHSNADDHLLKTANNEGDETAETIEQAKEATQETLTDAMAKANNLLQMVQKRFPFSLHHEVLAVNCSWGHAAFWNKEPDNVMHFKKALQNLQMISNAILKHGVASMIWHMLVAKRFTNTALLIEKVGKTPKERLCRRDIGFSDTVLEKFLSCCVDLLDMLMEANLACHNETFPSFNYEDFWQNRQGPTPLIEVAASQKETNYELICHHYQLAVVMHFLVFFNIKNYRPISFYDTKGKSAFFRDLHTFPPIPVQDIDLSISSARTRFLCRVISAAVESIPEPIPESSQSDSCSLPAVKGDSCNMSHWIGQVMDLAKLWGLDTDILRRHHVCELYSRGLDSLAEEILPSVSDTIIMGSQLILLAGQRIYSFIKQKFSSVEAYSRLSPNLTTWLKTLDQSSLHNLSPPLTMTATLIRHVINHLPEGHSEYQMALALVDAVHSLIDLQGGATRMITNTS